MKNTESGQKIVIAERDNIAAVIENGKVSEFFIRSRLKASGVALTNFT